MPTSREWTLDPPQGVATVDKAFHWCMSFFNKTGTLRELELFLEFEASVRWNESIKVPEFDPAAFPKDQMPIIELIHCRESGTPSDYHVSQLQLEYIKCEIVPQQGAPNRYVDRAIKFSSPEAIAEFFGWNYFRKHYNRDGEFEFSANYRGRQTENWNGIRSIEPHWTWKVIGSGWVRPGSYWREKYLDEQIEELNKQLHELDYLDALQDFQDPKPHSQHNQMQHLNSFHMLPREEQEGLNMIGRFGGALHHHHAPIAYFFMDEVHYERQTQQAPRSHVAFFPPAAEG